MPTSLQGKNVDCIKKSWKSIEFRFLISLKGYPNFSDIR